MLYIPIAPATKGTLSTMDESIPIDMTITFMLPMVLSMKAASWLSWPVDYKAAIEIRIPRKNKTLGTSAFRNA